MSYDWLLEHRDNSLYNKVETGVTPIVTDIETGVYDVTLTVTDNDGLTSNDTMVLTVDVANCAYPIAEAGPDQTVYNNQVALDGSASIDPDGIIESYDWTLKYSLFNINIPANDLVAKGDKIIVSGLKKGVYKVTLTVTDDDGLSDTDTMTVTSCFVSSLR